MNRCPITYIPCGQELYSETGLRLLSRRMKTPLLFPYTGKEQLQLASRLAGKLSIGGIQPKLVARLNVAKNGFEIVESKGTFILKPPHPLYPELPENEDLTMKLAATVEIEVPLHGLVWNEDRSLTYFIKRFDRLGHKGKRAVDFSQLSGHTRDTKYDSSMEKVVKLLNQYCTFPAVERLKLFRRTLFCFLIGNEDMHLKNFSTIEREGKIELAPAYDLVNSTLVVESQEELALPLQGKRSRFRREHFFDYFGKEVLGLTAPALNLELQRFEEARQRWNELIEQSFLSDETKDKYRRILDSRWERL